MALAFVDVAITQGMQDANRHYHFISHIVLHIRCGDVAQLRWLRATGG
jgi:hypothetical protein